MIMSFELYIDIDNDFDQFLTSRTCGYIKQNMEKIVMLLDIQENNILAIQYRRSASGHVHLKLELDFEPDLLIAFQVRALMHDDPWRIGIDLRRLAIQGRSEINRIFSTKVKNGITYQVEEWIDITKEVCSGE